MTILTQLSNSLDSSAVHSWRNLVDNLEDYSQQDILMLRNEREHVRHSHTHAHTHTHTHTHKHTHTHVHTHTHMYKHTHTHTHTHTHITHIHTHHLKGGSPTLRLFSDLHSTGWTILDLANLAKKAEVQIVIDVLLKYCQGEGQSL